MPGGRPSKFNPEMTTQAKKLAFLGATDREIADFFEVSESSLNNWKIQHPEFLEALKTGKEAADDRVEQSLYRRALGYSHDEDDIRTVSNAGGGSEIVVTPTVKHYPPDTTACIFWLKNRRKEQWRDRVEQELSGPNGTPLLTALQVELVKPQDDNRQDSAS